MRAWELLKQVLYVATIVLPQEGDMNAALAAEPQNLATERLLAIVAGQVMFQAIAGGVRISRPSILAQLNVRTVSVRAETLEERITALYTVPVRLVCDLEGDRVRLAVHEECRGAWRAERSRETNQIGFVVVELHRALAILRKEEANL